MVVHELFPTRVAQTPYSNHLPLKELILKLVDKHNNSDVKSDNGYSPHLFHMFQDSELLNLPELLDFNQFLLDSCLRSLRLFCLAPPPILCPLGNFLVISIIPLSFMYTFVVSFS